MSATKNNSNGMGGSHYRVPPEPNRWPAIGLAVGMHAMLLAFLVIGINWTNNQPVAVEAEVWDTTVQSAAPPAPTPPPAPEPEPQPRPETPPPTPRVAEPPPKAEPAPPKQPDIALEREKKHKEELKRQRQEEERIERERERELAKEQKREEEKKEKALAEKKKREDEKKAEELAKKEQEAEKKRLAEKEQEAEKKKLAEKEKAAKEKADKVAKAKAEKAEAAKLDKLRNDELKRMNMMAGAGSPSSTGSAEKSTGPRIDKGYIASIAAKIKGNTSYPGSTDVPGNPEVVFQVEQLPTGEILSVRKTKSSGIPAFDEAVERGINKSSPLPKKKDGTVERSVQVGFKLKEMN
ncbi:cell envelope integrity protein TolA [Massilia sp. LXY-6]|uniref:cell envelope integrity protein TolA n=1 Tax=Massilia sp. LXY-6 TaxID=3379823 RepID=UPI003EE00A3B